jgi:hypothetical protein
MATKHGSQQALLVQCGATLYHAHGPAAEAG